MTSPLITHIILPSLSVCAVIYGYYYLRKKTTAANKPVKSYPAFSSLFLFMLGLCSINYGNDLLRLLPQKLPENQIPTLVDGFTYLGYGLSGFILSISSKAEEEHRKKERALEQRVKALEHELTNREGRLVP